MLLWQRPNEYPWTLNLEWKLLHNDRDAVSLFASNPFPDKPPKYIRAVLYRYAFAKPGNAKGLWWTREKISDWIPAMSVNDERLIQVLKTYGWLLIVIQLIVRNACYCLHSSHFFVLSSY